MSTGSLAAPVVARPTLELFLSTKSSSKTPGASPRSAKLPAPILSPVGLQVFGQTLVKQLGLDHCVRRLVFRADQAGLVEWSSDLDAEILFPFVLNELADRQPLDWYGEELLGQTLLASICHAVPVWTNLLRTGHVSASLADRRDLVFLDLRFRHQHHPRKLL